MGPGTWFLCCFLASFRVLLWTMGRWPGKGGVEASGSGKRLTANQIHGLLFLPVEGAAEAGLQLPSPRDRGNSLGGARLSLQARCCNRLQDLKRCTPPATRFMDRWLPSCPREVGATAPAPIPLQPWLVHKSQSIPAILP